MKFLIGLLRYLFPCYGKEHVWIPAKWHWYAGPPRGYIINGRRCFVCGKKEGIDLE